MAKKANSGFDGTPIQIKRTKLPITDSKVTDDKEKLKFGQPFYLDNEKYLVIGDGDVGQESSPISDLKIFKAIDKQVVEKQLFFDSNTVDPTNLSNFSNLQNESGAKIYPKLRDYGQFTINASGTFYTFDNTGKLGSASTSTTAPVAYKVEIAGQSFSSQVVPTISQIIPTSNMNSSDQIKRQKKAFGMLTGVISFDAPDTSQNPYIALYFLKRPADNFIISVKGV